jgi:hypothetical protein
MGTGPDGLADPCVARRRPGSRRRRGPRVYAASSVGEGMLHELVNSSLGRLSGGLAHDDFVLDWGQAAERGLSSAAVVGALDPGDDGDPQLVAGGPTVPVEDIAL